jgi:DNA-binding response OmpR family regulator
VRPYPALEQQKFYFAGVTGDERHRALVLSEQKKTILICEDDRDLLRTYTLILRSKYDVFTATSGAEGIDRYSELQRRGRKVDLMLLDFRLGDTTGDHVAARIRDMDGTQIIMISAYDLDVELIGSLKRDGYIAGFVKKPVTMQKLASLVEAALGR